MDSELMIDDSPKVLELKEKVRQGKMSGHDFSSAMGVLRRSGKDCVETVRPTVPGTTKRVLVTPDLTVSASSSTATTLEAWGGKDNVAVGGRGTDGGRDPETGTTQGQARPQGSTSVLSKLGGRSVQGRRVDQMGSGVPASPSQDGRGGRSRRRSSGFAESPRSYDGGSVEGGSGGAGRRPWSAPRNAGRGSRRSVSVPCSPERPEPSPTSTPLLGDANGGIGKTQQRTQSVASTGHSGTGAGRRITIDAASGASAVTPLSASEVDNMSSVSNTSTVLSDLSIRLERIEGMLSRLLDTNTVPHPSGGAVDDSRSSTQVRSESIPDIQSGGSRKEGAADDVSGIVRDTSQELQEVKGRLRLLELEESARGPVFVTLAAAHGGRGLPTTTGSAQPERFPGGDGERLLQEVLPASELPEDDGVSIDRSEEGGKRALTETPDETEDAKVKGMNRGEATVGESEETLSGESEEGKEGRDGEGGEGEVKEELKGDSPDGEWGTGVTPRHTRSFGLSTISESPS